MITPTPLPPSPFPLPTANPQSDPTPTGQPTPQAAAGESVQVWLSHPAEDRLLEEGAVLRFSAPAGQGALVVNSDLLYQQMEGFGAALSDSSAWLIMNVLSPEARAEVLDNLFTRQGEGIGLSYVRVPMGASDFALRDYTYDDMEPGQVDPQLRRFNIEYDKAYIIPALKLAAGLNPQLRFMGSPWSAPAWMKRSGTTHGGELLPEYYQAFADYHVRFVQAYAAEGVEIDSLTPQNEPMYSTGGYPTMLLSAQGQQTLIRDFLGPALEQAGLDTRLVIFDHNWDLVDYPLEVLSDPAAAGFIDGVAFHCYGGDVANQSLVRQAHPDKGIWFTECSGGEWATDFADNLNWNVRTLIIQNFRNWGNSVMLWNLALDEEYGPQNGGCGDCRGVVTINQGSGDVTYNEEFTALGHVSKFVDPGAYRIDSSEAQANLPENVAFLNPDGSIVLLVQSDTATSFEVAWNGKAFQYDLPAKSVATFKWQAGVAPGPTVTPHATVTSRPTGEEAAAGQPPANPLLLDFENEPEIFSQSNAQVSLADNAHSGQASLRITSSQGNWHVGGARFSPRPLDLSAFDSLCFQVYDTTPGDPPGSGNSVGVRLVDAAGKSFERWSDHAEAGDNPKTSQNQWTQMCLALASFQFIDLTKIEEVHFNVYWPGDWYFDDIQVQ